METKAFVLGGVSISVNVNDVKKALTIVRNQMGVNSKDASQLSSHIVFMKYGIGVKILSGNLFNCETFLSVENDLSNIQDGAIIWGGNFKQLVSIITSLCKEDKQQTLSFTMMYEYSFIENSKGYKQRFACFNYECACENIEYFQNKYSFAGEIGASEFVNLNMKNSDCLNLTIYTNYQQEVYIGDRCSFIKFETSGLDNIDNMLGFQREGSQAEINNIVKAIKNNGLKIYKVNKNNFFESEYRAYAGGVFIEMSKSSFNFKAVKQGEVITKITFTKDDIQSLAKIAGKIDQYAYIFYKDDALILKEIGDNGESFIYDLSDCIVTNTFENILGLKVEYLIDLLKESDTIEFFDNLQAINGVGNLKMMLMMYGKELKEYPNPYYHLHLKSVEIERERLKNALEMIVLDNMKAGDKHLIENLIYKLNDPFEKHNVNVIESWNILGSLTNLNTKEIREQESLNDTKQDEELLKEFNDLEHSSREYEHCYIDNDGFKWDLFESVDDIKSNIKYLSELTKDEYFNTNISNPSELWDIECLFNLFHYEARPERNVSFYTDNQDVYSITLLEYMETESGRWAFDYLMGLLSPSGNNPPNMKDEIGKSSQIEWVIAGATKYYQFALTNDNEYRIIIKDSGITKIRFVTKEIYEFLYSYINYEKSDYAVELKPSVNGLWDKLYVFDFPITFNNDSVCFNDKKYKNGAEVYAYLEKNIRRLQRKRIIQNAKEFECFARKLERRYGIKFDIDFSNINIVRYKKGYYEYAIDGYFHLHKVSLLNLAIALKASEKNNCLNIETKKQYCEYWQDIERKTIVKCGDVVIENIMGCFCITPKEFVEKLKSAFARVKSDSNMLTKDDTITHIENCLSKTKPLTLKAKKDMIKSFLSSRLFSRKYKGWSNLNMFRGLFDKEMKIDICNDDFIIQIKHVNEDISKANSFKINAKDFVEWSNNLIKEFETCDNFYDTLHENYVSYDDVTIKIINEYPFIKLIYEITSFPRTIVRESILPRILVEKMYHNKTYSAKSLTRHFDSIVGALKNKAIQLRDEQRVIIDECFGWRIILQNGFLFLHHIESLTETFKVVDTHDNREKLKSIIAGYCGYIDRDYSVMSRIHYLYKDILCIDNEKQLSEELSGIITELIERLSLKELIEKALSMLTNYKLDKIELISLRVMAITLKYLYDDVLDITYDSMERYHQARIADKDYEAISTDRGSELYLIDRNNNQLTKIDFMKSKFADILLNRECEIIEGKDNVNCNTTIMPSLFYGIGSASVLASGRVNYLMSI